MTSNAFTREELKELAGDFPIEKLIISQGVDSCDKYYNRRCVVSCNGKEV